MGMYILAVIIGLIVLFLIYKEVRRKSAAPPYVPPSIDNSTSSTGPTPRKTPPEKF